MSSRRKIAYDLRLFLPHLLLCGLIGGCAPVLEGSTRSKVPSSDKVSVPFQHMSGLMVVWATLNERVSANLMVDTGASLTMISRATAKELGIDLEKKLPTIPVQTAAEIIYVPLVVLDSLEVGGMEVKNLTVAIYDPPLPSRSGLLGLNFLKQFRFEIDLKEGVLLLEKR